MYCPLATDVAMQPRKLLDFVARGSLSNIMFYGWVLGVGWLSVLCCVALRPRWEVLGREALGICTDLPCRRFGRWLGLWSSLRFTRWRCVAATHRRTGTLAQTCLAGVVASGLAFGCLCASTRWCCAPLGVSIAAPREAYLRPLPLTPQLT